ncbi:hypothetical protein [Luteolibacter sp. AS25]|uniref:hypothetical protein n=1 Tax=Luteolibacter sp. AS25 TaxID=3135776 RepID=UPI00398AEAE7
MKTSVVATILVTTIIATGFCVEEPLQPSKSELQSGWLRSWRSSAVGYGTSGVRSPFGRYLLLKNERSILALKLEKNHPLPDKSSPSSDYSWILYQNTNTFDHEPDKFEEVQEGTFTTDERSNKRTINVGGFRCKWSAGGWVYFPPEHPNLQMSVTEATEKDELKGFNVEWMSKDSIAEKIAADGTLTAVTELIDSQAPGGAAN